MSDKCVSHSYRTELLAELVDVAERGQCSEALIGHAFRTHVKEYRKILEALMRLGGPNDGMRNIIETALKNAIASHGATVGGEETEYWQEMQVYMSARDLARIYEELYMRQGATTLPVNQGENDYDK